MMMAETKIVFKLPEPNQPGFLKRTRRALSFYRKMSGGGMKNMTEETLDDLVDFLADYVEEPKDHQEAVEALWEASEEQIQSLLAALQGGGAEVPPESSAS